MGGAFKSANSSDSLTKNWAQNFLNPMNLTSQDLGKNSTAGQAANFLNPQRFGADIGGSKNASSNATNAAAASAAQAAQLEQLTLEQPKIISPDNFLASKTNALANLRLGLASTITGAGGAPSATLASPSLTASGQGKTKLGS